MAAVLPRFGASNAAELCRTRYTPYSPGYLHVDVPGRQEQLQHELNQAPGRKTAHNKQAKLWAQFPSKLQHPSSRYTPHPATADDVPASLKTLRLSSHKALAARLSEAAARQQRKQQQRRNDNVWTTHLAADVAAVCNELGLPAATSRVLAAAAAKGHITANPGVLLSQLVRLLPLEQQLWGTGSLGHILASLPQLVQYDPDTLLSNLAAAQQILGRSKTVTVVKRYPQLLTCTPFRLQSNISKLQDMLGFSSAASAAAVCSRQPLLLLSAPQSLQLRLQQVQQLFPAVEGELLSKQLRRSPELLLMKGCTMASKVKCLQQLFNSCQAAAGAAGDVPAAGAAGPAVQQGSKRHGSSRRQAAAAAQGAAIAAAGVYPQQEQEEGLLSWSFEEHQTDLELPELEPQLQQEVAAKLAQLKAATAQLLQRQQQQKQPQYQQQPQRQLLQRTGMLAHSNSNSRESSSSICDPRLQHLVLKVPALLSLSPETLQHHVTELQLMLGLQPDDRRLQQIVLLQPGLLTQCPATLANKLQLLHYLTGRGEAAVQEMVLKCPAVLTLSVANLTSKWAVLQKCVSSCNVWQEQLQYAANVTVAMTLCYSVQRLQRLEYVVEAAKQGLASSSFSGSRDREGESCDDSGREGSEQSAMSAAAANAASLRERQQQQALGSTGLLQQRLAAVPWRSLVQDTEQAFCKRYPGYTAWLLQQEQPDHRTAVGGDHL